VGDKSVYIRLGTDSNSMGLDGMQQWQQQHALNQHGVPVVAVSFHGPRI
jgi:hypothetical protein